ncbi:hypothetical protein GCM10027277_28620 [Pseudoduganella ginsengisoli]|uniref:DUF4785 family protein n=1 Tax=Pseudoduganella ginsengisoli TaxID=1462440 RepID=A0A6L6PZA2_9BURK|nr:DUF4785 domain-containing protein [Pseudoduganella ginsengisoli]MTW02963.1 DUF4785 family protein [Pseudoduganella ginsengisoli]
MQIMQMKLSMMAAALAACVSASAVELLPKQAGDLEPVAVAAAKPVQQAAKAGAPGQSREPVAMSWASSDAGMAAAMPHEAESRESYVIVTGAELAKGVPLNTTVPRAVVRVQALDTSSPRSNLAIHPQSMTVIDKAGRAHGPAEAMESLVTDDKLAKADMPFAPGTSAFRLHQDMGAGQFKLRADNLGENERFLINVVEPDSPVSLTMQAGAAAYLHGQQLSLTSELRSKDGSKSVFSKLEGYVMSPAGRRFPLTFKNGAGGRMTAQLALDADEELAPGLWEVHAHGQGKAKQGDVMRSLRLAFPVAMPTAKLDRKVALAEHAGGIAVNFGVEAAQAGRYEVRGVLYGTVQGVLKPIGVAHAAQWLEPGSGTIAMTFAPELRAAATGPYEIRELFLLDQGRLGVLQRQQRAVVIDERELARVSPRPEKLATAAPQRVK